MSTKPGRKRTGLKLPALHLYVGDWLKDPALSMCSPSSRGVWIDCICRMFENDRSGLLRGTVAELAQACRCSPDAMRDALGELRAKRAAVVVLEGEPMPPKGLPRLPPDGESEAPHADPHAEMTPKTATEAPSKRPAILPDFAGSLTLINRRMYREYSARKWAAFRQKQKYSRALSRRDHAASQGDSPANLTAPSSSSSSDLRGSKDPLERSAPPSPPSLTPDPHAGESTAIEASSARPPDTPANLGRSKPAVMALVNKHREAALRVFTELNAARRRIKPRANLAPSYDSLVGIAGRLEAGKTEQQCLHVIAVYEAEARAKSETWRFFDAVSPWRPDNFERALAQDGPANTLASTSASSTNAVGECLGGDESGYPYRMPDGEPWPREIAKLLEGLPLEEAIRKIDFLRGAEPFRFDERGRAKF